VILLAPGPVNVSPRVTAALARGDLCHREPEFSALLDGLSIQVALDDPEVDSTVAYDIAMRFAERELNLPAEKAASVKKR